MAATAPDDNDDGKTLYEILELTPSATLQEIKKSYRKLALLHHPDRNPPEKKEQATIQFRKVNEAYEILSDEDQRRQYDADLKSGRTAFTGGGNTAFHHHSRFHRRRDPRDPFMQFNDLFRNDPFFNEAFKDMDDLFAKTFQQQNGAGAGNRAFVPQQQQQPNKQPKSWGRWIADCLGIDFQIQTSTTTIGPDGRPQVSSTHTSYGGGRNRRQSRGGTSTYTSKSTRTVIENGQRVTIQSLEKDGNKIEEKYIDNQLVQRLINGVPEQQYRINSGGNGDL